MTSPQETSAVREQKVAMIWSLGVGLLMLGGKLTAYGLTGSAAILSDAAESVVHTLAVAFAAYSLWFSLQPVDRGHPFGHDRIHYFSAGFEGALIALAGVFIIYAAIAKWIAGLELERLGLGTAIVAGAGALNGGLGWYLLASGRRHGSLILRANGMHVLTDCWTSVGVVVGLLLAKWTGWLVLDPILAIVVACNILWAGGRLMRQSIGGLMDEADPATGAAVKTILDRRTEALGIQYHGLRHRNSGNTTWVEFDLLLPGEIPLREAHRIATQLEDEIEAELEGTVEIMSHLESIEDHESVHAREHFTGVDE